MHEAFPSLNSPTANEALIIERARSARADSIVRLDTYQRRLLHTFTKRWNADRERRGLSPVLAHDALTQGLESLIAMIGQE
jgi:hypothetical protein